MLRAMALTRAFDERMFRCIRSRSVTGEEPDPYSVLGVEPSDDMMIAVERLFGRRVVSLRT